MDTRSEEESNSTAGIVLGNVIELKSFETNGRRRRRRGGNVDLDRNYEDQNPPTAYNLLEHQKVLHDEDSVLDIVHTGITMDDEISKKKFKRDLPTLEDAMEYSKEIIRDVLEEHKRMREQEQIEIDLQEETSQFQAMGLDKALKLPPVLISMRDRATTPTDPKSSSKKQDKAPIKLFETLSPRTKKKIQRLPKPNDDELLKLGQLESTFFDMLSKNESVNILSKTSLYSSLLAESKPQSPSEKERLAEELALNKRNVLTPSESVAPSQVHRRAVTPGDQKPRQKKRQRCVNENGSDRQKLEPIQTLQSFQSKCMKMIEQENESIVSVMKDIRSMLPNTALFEYKLQSAGNNQKTKKLLSKLIRRYENAKLLPGWNRWKDFVWTRRAELRHANARRIQKFWIKQNCAVELQERKHQLEKQSKQTALKLEAIITKRQHAAQILLRIFRGFQGRKEVAYMRRCEQAALTVQCAWRQKKCQVLLLCKRTVEYTQQSAARNIQRVFRGNKARILARAMRKTKKVELAKRERERHLEKIKQRLKKLGAAVIIQAWWRGLQRKWLTRSLVMVTKRRAAITIQTFVRSKLGRMRFLRMVQERKEQAEQEFRAASLIQKLLRAKKAKLQVTRLREAQLLEIERKRELRMKQKQDRIINVMGRKVNLTEGHRLFFKVKNTVNPFIASRQDRAATKIQKVFRGYRARKRMKGKRIAARAVIRKARRDHVRIAVLKMQSRWRARQDRKRVEEMRRNRAATKLQSLFRSRRARKHIFAIMERNHAAKVVQRHYRGRLVRSTMNAFRSERKRLQRAALLIQSCARSFLSRQKAASTIEQKRFLDEARIQGNRHFDAALKLVGEDNLVEFAFRRMRAIEGADSKGPLQFLFTELSGGGTKLANDKFSKAMLQSRSLIRLLDRTTLDLLYARCKSPTDGGFGFPEFRDCLSLIGWYIYLKPAFDSLIESFKREEAFKKERQSPTKTIQTVEERRAERQGEKDRLKMKERELESELRSGFIFHRYKGNQALLLRLMYDHLQNVPFTESFYLFMHEEARKEMERASIKVQRRFRGVKAREFMELFREKRLQENETRKFNSSAIKIQSTWRMWKARQAAIRLLKSIIQKCLDPESQMPYYYNTHTEESSWTKPKLLGSMDIETTVRLPSKEDEYVVVCVKCKSTPANVACNECRDPFCDDCFRREHHSLQSHSTTRIEVCSECTFQAVTRFCNACIKGYCCTCFEIVHKVGEHSPGTDPSNLTPRVTTLQRHKYVPLVKQCVECEARAVKWRCDGCGDDYCSKCFKKIHRRGKRKGHPYRILPYMSVNLAELERKAHEDYELRQIRKRQKEVQKAMEKEAAERVALKLQAIWRGRQDRKFGKKLLKEARLIERKQWRQMKTDNVERKKMKYKVKNALGFAPILESDDEETKLRKMQGWKGSKWGKVVVSAGAMPYGEPLPALISLPSDPSDPSIDIDRDWTEVIGPGEYLKLNDQIFVVVRVGDGLSYAQERMLLKKEMKDLKELEFDKKEEDKRMVWKKKKKKMPWDNELNKGNENETKEASTEEEKADDAEQEDKGEDTEKKKKEKKRGRKSTLRKYSATALPRGVNTQKIVLDRPFDRVLDPSAKITAICLGELNGAQLTLLKARMKAEEKMKEFQVKAKEAREQIHENIQDAALRAKDRLSPGLDGLEATASQPDESAGSPKSPKWPLLANSSVLRRNKKSSSPKEQAISLFADDEDDDE